MRESVRFVVRGLVLGAWAALFVWLLASGEVYRYVGPRTYWVIIFGAITLIAATAFHFKAGADGDSRPLRVGDVLGLVAMVLPMLVLVLVPRPNLGALAASKKSVGGITGSVARANPPPGELSGPISLEDIDYASESSEYAIAVGIEPGVKVRLVGFVTHPKKNNVATFSVTRFAIFCCGADAIPYSAPVDASALGIDDLPDDQWVKLKGTLDKVGDTFVVRAAEIERIEEPQNPYLL